MSINLGICESFNEIGIVPNMDLIFLDVTGVSSDFFFFQLLALQFQSHLFRNYVVLLKNIPELHSVYRLFSRRSQLSNRA